MSTLPAEGIVFPEGEGDLSQAIEHLDDSNGLFFQAALDYRRLPLETRLAKMSAAAGQVANAYRDVARSIASSDEDPESQSQQIFGVLMAEDAKRVNTLNGILGLDALKPVLIQEEDATLTRFKDGLELDVEPGQEDQKIDLPLNSFISGMNQDIYAFLDHVRTSPRGKAVELGSALSKHAVDIGKVAVGTGIGIYGAVKWLEKRADI